MSRQWLSRYAHKPFRTEKLPLNRLQLADVLLSKYLAMDRQAREYIPSRPASLRRMIMFLSLVDFEVYM